MSRLSTTQLLVLGWVALMGLAAVVAALISARDGDQEVLVSSE